MEAIGDVLQTLSSNWGLILVLLIELIAAIVLLNGFFQFHIKKTKNDREMKNERLLHTSLSHSGDIAILLLRRGDFCPLYAVGDVKKMIGLNWEELYRDTEKLFGWMRTDQSKELRNQYRIWDRIRPLDQQVQRRSDGEWIEVKWQDIGDGQNDILTFRNITHDKEAADLLQEKLAEAEKASQSKTTFLSQMSHEIRTPMNGIIGLLGLAESHAEEAETVRNYLNKAGDLSQHLLSIINDVLDISRIEAGKIEMEEKPFDLFLFGDKLRNMFQKNVEAKGLLFDLTFQNLDVRYVIGDELRLSQIVVNFLSNALKFTSEGEITVTFRQMMKQNGVLDLMVRVHDTGIGMAPEFISRIFRPFEQENKEIVRQYGGTGLGMTITDQLVRLMGGEIFVESLLGKGSDFTVFLRLPIADEGILPAVQEEQAAEDGFSLSGLRILMAEDNEINVEVAVIVLEEEGAVVEVAKNGQEAVDLFAGHPAGYYDVILMDIQMPLLDGRAAARTIRRLERPDARQIPIIALSANAFVEDERMSIEAGMNGHIAKPIDFDSLRSKIGQYVHGRKCG